MGILITTTCSGYLLDFCRLPAKYSPFVRVVTGEEDVVFGDPSEVEMPAGLRSHGSTHECNIPIIGYNGNFEGFAFEENRDLGRYIFERVLD